jgi:hypothetical protein
VWVTVYGGRGTAFSLWYHSVQFIKRLVPLLLKVMLQWLKNKKEVLLIYLFFFKKDLQAENFLETWCWTI